MKVYSIELLRSDHWFAYISSITGTWQQSTDLQPQKIYLYFPWGDFNKFKFAEARNCD